MPVMRAICASQWMLGFVAACWGHAFVLLAYTDLADGGLSMNPHEIAAALSIMGLVSMGLKASLPLFLRRFDALTVFRFTLLTWPFTFAFMPILHLFARHAAATHTAETKVLLWIAIGIDLFLSRLGSLAFSYV